MKMVIRPSGPFNLWLGLRDATRQPFGLTERLAGREYQTVLLDRLVLVGQNELNGPLKVSFDGDDPQIAQRISMEIQRRFGLQQDLPAFYKFARKESTIRQLVKSLHGLTMFQKSSPFEALVTAIVDQQLTVSFTTRLKGRLITKFGRKYRFGSAEFRTFPSPETLAGQEEECLRPLQYSASKSRSVVRLAKGVVAGDYPLDNWSTLNDDDLVSALMRIHGVGRWTAEYGAMLGYNRCDVVPAADIGLQRAIQRCYGWATRPEEKEVRALAENWRPWRGLFTYYLWHAFE
ncbi:MAG: DNA-3-methyladenine glycosylase family protein [Fidelibacterota bacterium]